MSLRSYRLPGAGGLAISTRLMVQNGEIALRPTGNLRFPPLAAATAPQPGVSRS